MKNKISFDFLKSALGGGKSKKNQPVISAIFIFLFILFPFLISDSIDIYKSVRYSFRVALALMFPLFIFPNFVRGYLILIFVLFWIPYLINVYHYILFGSGIAKEGLMAIFETTPNEAFGFVTHFFNWKVGMLTAGLLLVMFIFIKLISVKSFVKIKHFLLYQKIFFLIFIYACFAGFFSLKPNRYMTMPFYIISQYKEFKWELVTLKIKNQREINKFQNIKNAFNDKKQTFVIIIGESASRNHYSLYGYERETNPLLSKRKDIFAFRNVVSPHAQTLLSLKKALSFASFENMDYLMTKGSIVNYFKDAGFKVFWISNQEKVGACSTYTSIVSNDADVKFFDTDIKVHTGKNLTNDYDIKDFYQNALNDNADKKVIFLHFSGSHNPYGRNVPTKFKEFKSIGSKEHIKINEYDNSIILNDYVINEYIEMLKKQGGLSYLLYFSDHGEDAGDTENSCFCHHEELKTQPMLNIPFIVWVSDRYKKLRKDYISKFNLDKQYNTEHLIHSVMSLSGLSNDDTDKSKSVFD